MSHDGFLRFRNVSSVQLYRAARCVDGAVIFSHIAVFKILPLEEPYLFKLSK